MRLSWDKYFIAIAKITAVRSGCNSRPTGAVIVRNKRIISTGYNGNLPNHPQCIDYGNDFCLRRIKGRDDSGAAKYQDCPAIHAEQNAINQIPLIGQGQSLFGASIYCTLQPCIHCLKNIVSVGIVEIVYELEYESDDKKRDRERKERISDYKMISRKVELNDKERDLISSCIKFHTSARRILKDGI